jgi:hypothetical protein
VLHSWPGWRAKLTSKDDTVSKNPTAPLPPSNTFCISFETRGLKGYNIKAVKITIEEDVMDALDTARIDLADHPLYKQLQQYVKANPR